jgi:catechol 2,3-dioxygenase-like lactoylglutathione lyase family enzyme
MLSHAVRQVALVVPDLDAAVRGYHEALGIGPWKFYSISGAELTGMTYRGRPAGSRMRYALAFSGELMLELIQPLEGESIWQEYLDARGPTLHHIAFYVDDFSAATDAMTRRGWSSVQTGDGFGRSRDGHFVYYEHPSAVGSIVEIVKAPTERWPPESTYPPEPR